MVREWNVLMLLNLFKNFGLLNNQLLNIVKKNEIKQKMKLKFFTNQSINKINFALEKFRYNVIIAVFHEIYSFFTKKF